MSQIRADLEHAVAIAERSQQQDEYAADDTMTNLANALPAWQETLEQFDAVHPHPMLQPVLQVQDADDVRRAAEEYAREDLDNVLHLFDVARYLIEGAINGNALARVDSRLARAVSGLREIADAHYGVKHP